MLFVIRSLIKRVQIFRVHNIPVKISQSHEIHWLLIDIYYRKNFLSFILLFFTVPYKLFRKKIIKSILHSSINELNSPLWNECRCLGPVNLKLIKWQLMSGFEIKNDASSPRKISTVFLSKIFECYNINQNLPQKGFLIKPIWPAKQINFGYSVK